ncbi:Oidioi.mRNA.OKI2018_I69.XSR.g13699.t1.cds [Oikopleura dioica]|uniref:Oidioi.mRNA.OKI2018_I69.XSR.g13699.t1.cds n=1 Tax=Oikopleura dioica TaxID=34765 RepID=A0ABN7S7N0_OIKDI|nr:Oidioi.mRNA.OKI2018_I69.XSR.g13699.t1.cds [Oikopleura dioica]
MRELCETSEGRNSCIMRIQTDEADENCCRVCFSPKSYEIQLQNIRQTLMREIFENRNRADERIMRFEERPELNRDNQGQADEADENCCRVCFSPFDKNQHHRAVIKSCWHTFCLSCLESVNPKSCPICRKPFETTEVQKLF